MSNGYGILPLVNADGSVDKDVVVSWAIKIAKWACYVAAFVIGLNIFLSILEVVIPALFMRSGHPGISLAPMMYLAEGLGRWRLGMPIEGMQQGSFQVAMTLALFDARPKDKRRYLCFGVGFDSSWWRHMIEDVRGGNAVFLEDNAAWMKIVFQNDASLTSKVHHVHYHTKIPTGTEVIGHQTPKFSEEERAWLDPSSTAFCSLRMTLPSAVQAEKYDVIMVDGPAGATVGSTGRYQAIFAAAQLVVPGGFVVVDDCERPIERAFADRLLGAHNLVAIRSRPRIFNRQGNSQCFYYAPRGETLPGAAAVCGNTIGNKESGARPTHSATHRPHA